MRHLPRCCPAPSESRGVTGPSLGRHVHNARCHARVMGVSRSDIQARDPLEPVIELGAAGATRRGPTSPAGALMLAILAGRERCIGLGMAVVATPEDGQDAPR